MQTRKDGKHDILPAATRIERSLDRVGVPVMLPRMSDGKMHRDGQSAAVRWQPDNAVAECGRVHRAPELSLVKGPRVVANYRVSCRRKKEERLWRRRRARQRELRGRDKRPRGAASVGRVVSVCYAAISRCAEFPRTSRQCRFPRDFLRLTRCAEFRP